MSKIRLLLAPILLMVGFIGSCLLFAPSTEAAAPEKQTAPVVREGTLDLSGWDLSVEGSVELNGGWFFYPQQLWSPSAGTAPQGQPLLLKVPKSWGEQPAPNDRLSNQGFGTYRLHIRLKEADAERTLALYMPSVATAYRLWVNGIETAGNGTVGTSLQSMVPKNYAKVVLLPSVTREFDVVIQVSNFVQRKGGLWSPIRFGYAPDIIKLRERNVSLQLLFAVSNLVLFLYHTAIYLLRRREKPSLYLGLFCAMIALRTLLLDDTLLVSWIPSLPWELAVKLEYLSAFGALSLFPLFVAELYPHEAHRRLVRFFLWNGVVFALLVVLLPARWYTQTLIYYELIAMMSFPYLFYVYIHAIRAGRQGSLASVFAALLLMGTVLNDILFYNELLPTLQLESFGMLLFVFVQTLIIAYRFTNAYRVQELLSEELQLLNATLEHKVEERTAKLTQSYAELQRLLESRRRLLSNISHDLGTPMTIILGFVSAMLDGVIAEDQHGPYLLSIQNKIVLMERIIKDLFDLSRLEAKQVELTILPTSAERLLEQAEAISGLDAQARGVAFHRSILESPQGSRCIVHVDSVRIQQVFGNLIQNASKHTPSGGTIEVGGRWIAERKAVRFYVTDTGKGISPASLPRVFDRFFQDGVNRLPHTGGSGLGLAIAKEIIDLHGGQIGIESQEGTGTTVWFELPSALEETQA